MTEERLKLRFGGSLVEQLGAQLYPSATATVAELISNAWDADAEHVWVTIPFGESWTPESELVVVDDGIGMTHDEAQEAYLVVGRKRRLAKGDHGGDHSPGGRPVHGRKGIGKLAAFGTARILECITLRADQRTAFRLEYDAIRRLKPDEDYLVEPIEQDVPLVNPETGEPLEHGARIRLTRLHLKRALAPDQFMRSMSRRFAIDEHEMRVLINGVPLRRFDIDVQVKFPRDGKPSDDVVEDPAGWARETLRNGKAVRWWIGFTEKPLEDEAQQGISVLTRKKMAQRPFKFERGQGTTGQLGQEYLVGEVEADWLDEGADIEDDLIQSNRDQLQLEDARLDMLLEWGKQRLRWALAKRNEIRQRIALDSFQASSEVEEILEPYTPTEKKRLLRVAQIVSKLPEIGPDNVADVMRNVVDAQSDVAVRSLMERIEGEDDPVQERMWVLVHEFGLIDARRLLSVIKARISTIEKLKAGVRSGAREVPDLHKIVQDDPWLLDPRWHLLGHEVNLNTLKIDFEPETDAETGDRLDFLFVLAPRLPAPADEVVVVEIKRGTYPNGRERKADEAEVQKFHRYVLAVEQHYAANTDRPRVQGLMVAQGYTARADPLRRNLEQIVTPRMRFKTWELVIDETNRMHLGWLNVSLERAGLPAQ